MKLTWETPKTSGCILTELSTIPELIKELRALAQAISVCDKLLPAAASPRRVKRQVTLLRADMIENVVLL